MLIQKGYRAEAPFSGTEYDLVTGRMTIYTEGKPIDRVITYKGNTRADIIFNELVATAEKLLTIAKGRRGMTNKENARLTSQIRDLCEKYKD